MQVGTFYRSHNPHAHCRATAGEATCLIKVTYAIWFSFSDFHGGQVFWRRFLSSFKKSHMQNLLSHAPQRCGDEIAARADTFNAR